MKTLVTFKGVTFECENLVSIRVASEYRPAGPSIFTLDVAEHDDKTTIEVKEKPPLNIKDAAAYGTATVHIDKWNLRKLKKFIKKHLTRR